MTGATPTWSRPATPVALAKAISHVLADRAHADQLIASGAERAAAFSMEHLAEIYVEQYARAAHDVAAGRSPPPALTRPGTAAARSPEMPGRDGPGRKLRGDGRRDG